MVTTAGLQMIVDMYIQRNTSCTLRAALGCLIFFFVPLSDGSVVGFSLTGVFLFLGILFSC